MLAARQTNFPVSPWIHTASYSVSENGQLFITGARRSHSSFCKVINIELQFCFWKAVLLVLQKNPPTHSSQSLGSSTLLCSDLVNHLMSPRPGLLSCGTGMLWTHQVLRNFIQGLCNDARSKLSVGVLYKTSTSKIQASACLAQESLH